MIIAAMAAGHNVDQLADRILVAHWAEDADHDDADTLISLAQAVGLDGADLLAAAEDPAIAGQYQAFTDEAIERVVFGSPTYVVDGDMFYGQDHLEMLEQALQKPFAKTWPLLSQ
jgi:2-hydroxychromene-2-carboxylate isomerase